MKEEVKIKILFITNTPVPYGMAVTNRLMSLAKGITANNHEARIIIINPTEKSKKTKNTKTQGDFEGIKYQYLNKSTIWPQSSIARIIIYIKGIFKIMYKLLILTKSNKPNAIIIQNMPNIYILNIYLIAKLKGIILLQERNELPTVQNFTNPFRKLDTLLSKFSLRILDGMVLITEELCSYFKDKVSEKCILEHIKMTVDNERFNINIPYRPLSKKYIAYAGTMSGNKDGMSDLLDAFSIVIKDFPELILCLIGDISNKEEYSKLKNNAVRLAIQDNVLFTGLLEGDQIPAYFLNAELLLLARPDNLQASGGFPTKLGEYLASGIPVVITDVGEITNYLSDGENAFISESDNPTSFASKVTEAMKDYQRAKKIGQKGKKVATEIFSYKVQGLHLIKMIRKIINK